MALTAEEAARLVSLRAARDALVTGSKVEKVQTAGRSVEYGPGDLAALDRQIGELESGGAAGRRRGPIRFRFG